MKKILFTTTDTHGVSFYRINKPAVTLQKLYGKEYHVEINKNPNWNNDNYLKNFDIIHCHRTLCEYEKMPMLINKLRKFGVKVVLDIDDYWTTHKLHPMWHQVKISKLEEYLKENIKMIDYVTTTSPVFADYIKPLNKNVVVLENAVDDSDKEFQLGNKYENDFFKIMYLGGSSHLEDLRLLKHSFEQMLTSDVAGKYQLHLVGFDLRGYNTSTLLNPELEKELHQRGLLNNKTFLKDLVDKNFEMDKVKGFPQDLLDKYKGNYIYQKQEIMKPEQTVWYQYEKEIFTSNFKLIKDKGYINFLHEFNLDKRYHNELETQPYIRHKTQGVYNFAHNYRYADVALAPIAVWGVKNGVIPDTPDNRYQLAKSNLKIIESAFHKVPLVASEVPIYTFDKRFKDKENIFFISVTRQDKDWAKVLKYLIKNPNHAKDAGEKAYEIVKEHYHINTITKKRKEFYDSIV